MLTKAMVDNELLEAGCTEDQKNRFWSMEPKAQMEFLIRWRQSRWQREALKFERKELLGQLKRIRRRAIVQ